jgi:hypothetical protein
VQGKELYKSIMETGRFAGKQSWSTNPILRALEAKFVWAFGWDVLGRLFGATRSTFPGVIGEKPEPVGRYW